MENNSKQSSLQSGFTLLELLVVVAVIGLLAAAVVAALSNARAKASDKASQADLNNIRTQASLYFANSGSSSYGITVSDCTSGMYSDDTTIASAIAHATTNSSSIACSVGPTNQTFAIAVTLKSGAGYYCVDSNNTGKLNNTATSLSGTTASSALNTTTGLCS